MANGPQANNSGISSIGGMFIFSAIISVMGFLLYIDGKSDTWLPTDQEVYGLILLYIGGGMFLITGLFYWVTKE